MLNYYKIFNINQDVKTITADLLERQMTQRVKDITALSPESPFERDRLDFGLRELEEAYHELANILSDEKYAQRYNAELMHYTIKTRNKNDIQYLLDIGLTFDTLHPRLHLYPIHLIAKAGDNETLDFLINEFKIELDNKTLALANRKTVEEFQTLGVEDFRDIVISYSFGNHIAQVNEIVAKRLSSSTLNTMYLDTCGNYAFNANHIEAMKTVEIAKSRHGSVHDRLICGYYRAGFFDNLQNKIGLLASMPRPLCDYVMQGSINYCDVNLEVKFTANEVKLVEGFSYLMSRHNLNYEQALVWVRPELNIWFMQCSRSLQSKLPSALFCLISEFLVPVKLSHNQITHLLNKFNIQETQICVTTAAKSMYGNKFYSSLFNRKEWAVVDELKSSLNNNSTNEKIKNALIQTKNALEEQKNKSGLGSVIEKQLRKF